MTHATPLKDRVRQAFKNATENGYEFLGMTTAEIAIDMVMCDADLECEDVDQVARALEEIGEE